MTWLFRDPPRDPRVGAALRQLEIESHLDDATLEHRISAAARARSTGLRSTPPRWWEWLPRWVPVAVPIGIAASLAAGLLLPGVDEVNVEGAYAVEMGSDSTLIIAAFAEGSSGNEWAGHLVAPENGDWLLEQAVSQ
jgi:hypothetical protein